MKKTIPVIVLITTLISFAALAERTAPRTQAAIEVLHTLGSMCFERDNQARIAKANGTLSTSEIRKRYNFANEQVRIKFTMLLALLGDQNITWQSLSLSNVQAALDEVPRKLQSGGVDETDAQFDLASAVQHFQNKCQ